MKRLGQPILALFLASCLVATGGMYAAAAVEHEAHHAHHSATTHSSAICAWMCAAGHILQGYELGLDGPTLTPLVVETAKPSTTDALIVRAPRSRAPPSF